MLLLVLQANYGEKISLMQIFSFVNTNAPGLWWPLITVYELLQTYNTIKDREQKT